jgi:hypothetical protein
LLKRHPSQTHRTDFSNHINSNDYFGNGLSPVNANDRIPGKNIIVDHTWTIKQNLVFEHHFSWAHSESNRAETVLKSPASLGFNVSNVAPRDYGQYDSQHQYQPSWRGRWLQFVRQLLSVRGQFLVRISICGCNDMGQRKAHGQIRSRPQALSNPAMGPRVDVREWRGSGFTVGYTFGTTTALTDSGNGVAELLMGLGSVTSGYEPETQSVHDYAAAYIQDEFRITRRLLLTYSLRYGYETGDVEKNNLFNYLDTTSVSPLQIPSLALTGGVGIPGLNGTSRQLQNPQKTNLDPRVGVAYNLNDKTVIHAGFGIVHHPAAAWQQYPNADGGIRTTTSVDSQANGVTPFSGFQLSNPFPVGLTPPDGNAAGLGIDLGDSIEGPLRRQYIPYQQNWSLDIQRSLPGSFVVTAAYVGNEGVHLMVNQQLNQLPDSDLAPGSKLLTLVSNPLYGHIDPASSINTPR